MDDTGYDCTEYRVVRTESFHGYGVIKIVWRCGWDQHPITPLVELIFQDIPVQPAREYVENMSE